MRTGSGITLAAMLAMALPAALAAQEPVVSSCAPEAQVGSLGITGIRCERCSFFTNGKVHRAVFFTEPTIEGLNEDMPAARVLREGDVLVAVEGELITTRRGSERFSNLPAEGSISLRVRRDGRLREIRVPVAPVCAEDEARVAGPVVEGRAVPIPPPPPRTAEAAVPAHPLTPAEPVEPSDAVVAPMPIPPPPEDFPRPSLGFGFRCGDCGIREEAGGPPAWSFRAPPEVYGVERGSSAWTAGFREGDRIVAIDQADITSPSAGRRFGRLAAGDTVRWTVERNDRRLDVVQVLEEREEIEVAEIRNVSEAMLKFSGTVGDALVEVRGGPVTVTESESGRIVVIRTRDTEIRIRVAPSGGGRR